MYIHPAMISNGRTQYGETKKKGGLPHRSLGQRARTEAPVHLGCWNGSEEAVLLEVASLIVATITVEEEEAAENEAKRTDQPGLTIFTDGPRLENGATGYAVAWKKCQTWKGHKTHMGWARKPTTPSARPSRGPCR